MTTTDLALLIAALTGAVGTLGRGVVWLVQRQADKTLTAKNDELAWLWAMYEQSEAENAGLRTRLTRLGLTP